MRWLWDLEGFEQHGPAAGRVSNQSSATATTAASGWNREELLGPRSDFSKPRQGAAEKSANATRRCCLVRGFQPV